MNKPITVSEIWSTVGEEICAKWEALGQTESSINWGYGREAEVLIAEGYPAMQVYKAIAIKACVSSQTVRKSYNVYMAFDEATRRKYDLCPFGVFQIARGHDQPEKVLKYYLEKRCSIDELKEVFPNEKSEKREKFETMGYPRYFWGILREIYGTPRQAEAIEHLDWLNEYIKELEDEDE